MYGCLEGEDSMGMGLVLGMGEGTNRGERKGKERKEESAVQVSASCHDA